MAGRGVLLMGFGGPDSLAAITPFMENMTGRAPAPPALERIEAKYAAIGGASPITARTEEQAALLAKELGPETAVAVGMRYWKPFIGEGIDALAAAGAKRIACIPMAPFGSAWSTAAYREEIEKHEAEAGLELQLAFADGWSADDLFPRSVAQRVREATAGTLPDIAIFTAHSLPASPAADEYAARVRERSAAAAAAVPGLKWDVAFQSQGMRGGEWLGPSLDEKLTALPAGSGVLVVPIGFTCDHVETLYDLDIEARCRAEGLGLDFGRTEALNDEPLFIELLARTARRALDGEGV